MRRIFLLIAILLLFGCTAEKDVSSLKKDVVISSEEIDLNQDGTIDFATFAFAAAANNGVKTTRTVNVYAETSMAVEGLKDVTDADILLMQDRLVDFTTNYDRVDAECSTNMGLLTVSCPDQRTCANICSANSLRCKRLIESFGEPVGHSVFLYVRDNNEVRSALQAINRGLPRLGSASKSEKLGVVENIEKLIQKLSSISANPIFTQFELCERGDYEISKLADGISKKLAFYSTPQTKFNYRVTILIELTTMKIKGEKQNINGIAAGDSLPIAAGVIESSISSPQEVSVGSNMSGIRLQWQLTPSNEKVMLFYEFSATTPPQELMTKFTSPSITLKIINLDFMQPVVLIYGILYGMTGNFYVSFAAALAISVIAILLVYKLAIMLYHVAKSKVTGETISHGVYVALRKTRVAWKSDIIAAVVSLAIGVVVMNMFPREIKTQLTLFETIDLMTNSPTSVVAIAGISFGLVFLYLSVENRFSIYALEQRYGKKFKDEKALFIGRGTELKTRLEELKGVIAASSAENFDVSAEYDFVSSMSTDRISELIRKMDPLSKREVEDYLTKVEEALSRLHELKRLSEQNWQVWEDYIVKMLNESDEIHASGLVTIPVSLRTWALNKFIKDHAEYGLVFEGEVVKRKEVSPDKIALAMINKKLLCGAVLIKNGKATFSKSEEGNPTIVGALAVKMLGYLRSAVKNVGQHDYNSTAVIGEKLVLILLKHQTMEAMLIIEKDKFKEAMEEWKSKMKNL